MLLSRLLPKAKPFSSAHRLLYHFSSTPQFQSHPLNFPTPNPIPHLTSVFSIRHFSTDHNDNGNFFNNNGGGGISSSSDGDSLWKLPSSQEDSSRSWLDEEKGEEDDIFGAIDKEGPREDQQWSFDFTPGMTTTTADAGVGVAGYGYENKEKSSEELAALGEEEKHLISTLEGTDRAFGDLIAASGITDEMLDTLIALKDFEGVEGLPPLSEIEDLRYEKNTRKSTRAEIELQKQEELAKARVRKVDEKGRAYGTGRRKCSVARVWVQPGHGNFVVNDKQFDVYFPMLDHRAALLRPFAETKTLGLWDIRCTVKGGGVSGQLSIN
ncbi:hypothetical protein Tsubulata_037170 [Turnera subulata]|uniref:30S ribosomal protein S9 n=1 Tax=Turnera subulata TaxID=218843 RepID=A0A9Q0FWZ3_9ROSI|nr:hypothetical protein Tsubulata_037170 [Turnera subulata]